MATSGTTNDNEWQRVATIGTTNYNEWYNEWGRMATSNKKFLWVTTNDNEGIKVVLINFAKFTVKHLCCAKFMVKHLCWSLFFNKVIRSKLATLSKRDSSTGAFQWILRTKKRLQHIWCHVIFAIFFWITF